MAENIIDMESLNVNNSIKWEETSLADKVPDSVKQLPRLIVRGFYTDEDKLIVDLLVRFVCMREEDLEKLLKFDLRQLRARLNTLCHDKVLEKRTTVELVGSGPQRKKINYYFINYRTLHGMLDFKLEKMVKKIEVMQRDTHLATYQCLFCSKKITDLFMDKMLNYETGELSCIYCKGDLMEKKQPKIYYKKVSFKSTFHVFFELLEETKNLVNELSNEIFNPKPINIDKVRESKEIGKKSEDNGIIRKKQTEIVKSAIPEWLSDDKNSETAKHHLYPSCIQKEENNDDPQQQSKTEQLPYSYKIEETMDFLIEL